MKEKIREIYTVATAHLDTSWLWTLEKTIEDFIPRTMDINFEHFKKFPEYKFNFEGSYRYELMEEYYPEKLEKVKQFINEGRWSPCGSCYENGDVNTPSPEALLRNILYGNGYFSKQFGVESNDIFLPDCFGFGRALPSIASHAGLKGFSTQKLTWGGAVDVPFDVGRWTGKDGNGLWCALKPGNYISVFSKLRSNPLYLKKIKENEEKYGYAKTVLYHGSGDRGGAPTERSVKNMINELRKNNSSKTKVYSATTKEIFDELESLDSEKKKKLPVWDGEFLLTTHGTGSYTSRTVSKRWNRRGELLADAAERYCVAAKLNSLADYPQYTLDTAWKKLIAHQFHDDITGTSFAECYKRNWNDYVLSMNSFSAEYTNAVKALAKKMNTSFVKGIPVVVSNPVQSESVRSQSVSAVLPKDFDGNFISVFDSDGNEVPSQLETVNNKKTAVFIASVPSIGLAVYDIRPSDKPYSIDTALSASENTLENEFYLVKLDSNGDICSITDKKRNKELLSAPIRMALLNDFHSTSWPAWEIKYKDVCASAYAYAKAPSVKLTQNGCAKCTLEVTRKVGKSTFIQKISLDSSSKFISIENETDWREEATLLKAQFPLAVKNKNASYDIGIGSTQRATNTERCYEVPAQRWADITDENGCFGVSVLSDSRCGWDKPDGSTLRLTCMHTPLISFRWECSQHMLDMGLNRYSFGIYSHGEELSTPAVSDEFCQPMHTFICEKHKGTLGKTFSLLKVNNDSVRVMAVKKAQEGDDIIVRVVETSGKNQNGVKLEFSSTVKSAAIVSGDEKKLCDFEADETGLTFDLKENEIRSFAVTFEKKRSRLSKQVSIELPFNAVAVTKNSSRESATLPGCLSVPFEIMPEKLLFSGVNYEFKKDGESAVVCKGQKIKLEADNGCLHLLLTSLGGDREVEFVIGEKKIKASVQDCFEAVGAWDLVSLGETGYIKAQPQALTLTHVHKEDSDVIAKNFYLFHTQLNLDGETELTLPNDENIVLFAATLTEKEESFTASDEHFDRLEKREFDYEVSKYAKVRATEPKLEKWLDKRIDRTKIKWIDMGPLNMVQTASEVYYTLQLARNMITMPFRKRELLNKRKKNLF